MMTIMVRKVMTMGVADAKARLSELLDRVARGERVIVAKRGKPVAVLAPPDAVIAESGHSRGLASLAGVMSDWPELERDMADVMRRRRSARDRQAPDLG
jgi:prevent-host-death family protein